MARLTKVVDHFIRVKSALANAIERLLEDKLDDSVSIKDFGAVGDGVTDDTAAINNALSVGKALRIPTGIYICSGELIANKGLSLKGDGIGVTEFRFTGNSNGLTIKLLADASDPVTLSGFSITTTTAPTLTKVGLKIDGSRQVLHDTDPVGHRIIGNRSSNRGSIGDIEIRGVNTNIHAWGIGLNLLSIMNFKVDGYHFSGKATEGEYTEIGILYSGDGVPVDVSFNRLWIYYATHAFLAPDYNEGVHINNFEFINVTYGITAGFYSSYSSIASGITGALAYYIGFGHIYARAIDINIYNTNQSRLSSLVLYTHARASDSVAYGIRIVSGANVDIRGIYSNLSPCLNTKENNRSILLETCTECIIDGVETIGYCQSSVTLTGGSTKNNISNVITRDTNYMVDEVGGANINNIIGESLNGTVRLKRVQLPTNLAANYVNYRRIQVTGTVTLAASVGVVTITPPVAFDAKPKAIAISVGYSATGVITGYYDYDASTTSGLVIRIRGNASGPTEVVRYMVDYPLS